MINIAELLKDAPKGMKLYSPLLGEVEFAEVMDTDYVPIRVMCGTIGERFDEFGRYKGNEYPNAECLLFPSKDCRTWEGWTPPVEPKFKFKVGDWIANDYCAGKVIALTDDAYLLDSGQGIPFSCEHNAHLWTIADAKDGDVLVAHEVIVLFKEIDGLNIRCYFSYHYMNTPMVFTNQLHNKMAFRPATKDERELLFAKMKEEKYEWDVNKKELRKIQPHYDIANFQPFDKVLVRDGDLGLWKCDIFSDYYDNFYCFRGTWKQCIPFNEETKHLLGTTDMCDECYINW